MRFKVIFIIYPLVVMNEIIFDSIMVCSLNSISLLNDELPGYFKISILLSLRKSHECRIYFNVDLCYTFFHGICFIHYNEILFEMISSELSFFYCDSMATERRCLCGSNLTWF